MATQRRKKHLKYFYDHEDQEAKDLKYGAQQAPCKALAKRKKKEGVFNDASIGGEWIPDED